MSVIRFLDYFVWLAAWLFLVTLIVGNWHLHSFLAWFFIIFTAIFLYGFFRWQIIHQQILELDKKIAKLEH